MFFKAMPKKAIALKKITIQTQIAEYLKHEQINKIILSINLRAR